MKHFFSPAEHHRSALALVDELVSDRQLLSQSYRGEVSARVERDELTEEQCKEVLGASIYQLLYHSQVAVPFQETELQLLFNQARRFNTEQHITGILLYSSGRFFQLLEGPQLVIESLYERIGRDTRHEQVITVSRGTGRRLFANWSMAAERVNARVIEQLLIAIQVHTPPHAPLATRSSPTPPELFT